MMTFYFTELPGLAVSTQQEMARTFGYIDAAPSWTDTKKSFPTERGKLLGALRRNDGDIVWVASLPVLAANRHDLRHVINVLTELGADIIEGATGWRFKAPYEEGLGFANFGDYWAKRRKLLDDPRGAGRTVRNGAKGMRMPDSEARTIWLDPTIISNELAIEKMNADPRYKIKWTYSTACNRLKKSGRPPGARPKSLPTETSE